ncbi:MAG: DUF6449 domain-containing protein [Lachnospiraceae bacterium]|nr:DUF6449 domain-containing protein [Lachnospiraceae bacterium]
MISKKLSAKKLFGRLMKAECFRKVWAAGVMAILLIFALPMRVALELGRYAKDYSEMPDSVMLNFIVQNEVLMVLIFVSGVFMAIVEFSYLFRRDKVDFYFSLPIGRSMQFFYRFLTGFLLFAIPYLIMYGISILVAIAHGALIEGYVRELAVMAVMYLLFYWVIYSVSVMAIQFAGSFLSGIVLIVIIHFAGPFLCFILNSCQSTYFRTFVDTGKPLLFGQGSIITICHKVLAEFSDMGFFFSRSIGILIVTAVLIPVAAYMLFWKRPAEKSGYGLAFPIVGPFIGFLMVAGVGMTAGLFLAELSFNNSDFWLYCGVVIGCVVMHVITQMILNMNFRAFFGHKLLLLSGTAAALLVISIFRFDLLGFDSFLPKADQLSSVGVSFDELEYYRSHVKEYTKEAYEARFKPDRVYSIVYGEESDKYRVLKDMNISNVGPVLEIVSRSIKDKTWKPYKGNMTVCYRLKNGTCVYRSYYTSVLKEKESVSDIFDTEGYKGLLYPILTRGEDDSSVWISRIGNYYGEQKKLDLTDVQYTSLLRTYKRELKDLHLETLCTEEPLLNLEFTVSQDDYFNAYPVYPSFKHTLTLLKGYGYEFKPVSEQIYKVQVAYNPVQEAEFSEGEVQGSGIERETLVESVSTASEGSHIYWTTSKKELEQLKPWLISCDNYSMNLTLKEVDPDYSVTGYLLDPETGEESIMQFVIQKGKIPKFLKKLKK